MPTFNYIDEVEDLKAKQRRKSAEAQDAYKEQTKRKKRFGGLGQFFGNKQALMAIGMGLTSRASGGDFGQGVARGLQAFEGSQSPHVDQRAIDALMPFMTDRQKAFYSVNPGAVIDKMIDQEFAQSEAAKPRIVQGVDGRQYWAEGPNAGTPVLPGLEQSRPPADFKDVSSLRKEWNGITSDFQEIQRNSNVINTVAARGDAAGDLALVVAFTKLLDPGSVAREGEVALTQSAQGLAQRAGTLIERLRKGDTLLNAETRMAFVEAANDLSKQYRNSFDKRKSEYSKVTETFFPGLDPSLVLVGSADPLAPVPAARQFTDDDALVNKYLQEAE